MEDISMDQDNKSIICDCDVIHSEVVERVSGYMPGEEKLYDLADFFKIFGDSTRIKILWALDREEMCVCDLAVLLNMTKSAISHQLKTLRQEKLVKYRRDGKSVFYSLQDEHVKDILEIGLEHIEER
jgi:DNA-binding transcriptional ArsR family regulator